ncbi:NYN domain-containing protein [Clostridium sp. Marseille-P299]|uniref:NYN domain-containing protein n=1 Tax=Clostridium sp. Marseille-P299 TaxID=1805477 RepID=UPI00082DC22B|nr:NYN domain-containing protein [Clostridium sp. Marseille-P299]
MEDKRFAVLIDADNISAKYIKYILDEISKYGSATYKRIYGDWTKSEANSWKEVLLENSIVPIQQYSYTTGKNATDSAMIIDAMDILYSNKVEGFCLASSDSDFTRLAMRLRESGMMVIGMGEKKTPEPFRAACERFTYLDVLAQVDQSEGDSSQGIENESTVSIQAIEATIIKIITENVNDGRETGIGEVGSRLVKLYPDFDVRNYGYTKLSKFLDSIDSLKTRISGSTITVYIRDNTNTMEHIESVIRAIIKETGKKRINMGELNQKLRVRIPEFNVNNYGYTKFSKFLQEFPAIRVIDNIKGGTAQTVVIEDE